MADVSTIKNYVVAIGFDIDEPELRRVQAGIENVFNTLERELPGFAKVVVGVGGAIVGAFVAMAGAAVSMMNKVSQGELQFQLYAMRMNMSVAAAKKLKIGLDALGATVDEVFWNPELRARFKILYQDQIDMQKALGPEYAKNMKNIRDIAFEFTRMRVSWQYLQMGIVNSLEKALGLGEGGLLKKLQSINQYIHEHMQEISDAVAKYLVPVIYAVVDGLEAATSEFLKLVGSMTGDKRLESGQVTLENIGIALSDMAKHLPDLVDMMGELGSALKIVMDLVKWAMQHPRTFGAILGFMKGGWKGAIAGAFLGDIIAQPAGEHVNRAVADVPVPGVGIFGSIWRVATGKETVAEAVMNEQMSGMSKEQKEQLDKQEDASTVSKQTTTGGADYGKVNPFEQAKRLLHGLPSQQGAEVVPRPVSPTTIPKGPQIATFAPSPYAWLNKPEQAPVKGPTPTPAPVTPTPTPTPAPVTPPTTAAPVTKPAEGQPQTGAAAMASRTTGDGGARATAAAQIPAVRMLDGSGNPLTSTGGALDVNMGGGGPAAGQPTEAKEIETGGTGGAAPGATMLEGIKTTAGAAADWAKKAGGMIKEASPSIEQMRKSFGKVKDWTKDNVQEAVIAAAKQLGVPPEIALGVAKTESNFNPSATSKAGAHGVMQLMPKTAAGMGVGRDDVMGNIAGGVGYLKSLHNEFHDWKLALMAYNWGPGNVEKWIKRGGTGFVPAETQQYTGKVMSAAYNNNFTINAAAGMNTQDLARFTIAEMRKRNDKQTQRTIEQNKGIVG